MNIIKICYCQEVKIVYSKYQLRKMKEKNLRDKLIKKKEFIADQEKLKEKEQRNLF